VCGKRFQPSKKEYTTCSHACGVHIRKGKTAKKKVVISCVVCKKEFERTQYKLDVGGSFCSLQCYWLDKKKAVRGEKNSNYKGGPRKAVCVTCGSSFETYHKTKKFCSHKCVGRVNLSRRGTRYELKCVLELRDAGYTVVRSTRSLGPFDVIAFRDVLRLVQD